MIRLAICDGCGEALAGRDFGRVTGNRHDVSLRVCRPCVALRVADVRIRQGLGDLSDRALLDGVLPRIGKVDDPGPLAWSSLADQLGIDRLGLICNDAERAYAERNGRLVRCGIHAVIVVDDRCRRCDVAASGLRGVSDAGLCIERIDAQRAGDTTRVSEVMREQGRRREARATSPA